MYICIHIPAYIYIYAYHIQIEREMEWMILSSFKEDKNKMQLERDMS